MTAIKNHPDIDTLTAICTDEFADFVVNNSIFDNSYVFVPILYVGGKKYLVISIGSSSAPG